MENKRLTDEEIIEAFKCCMRPPKCDNCPCRIDPRNCKDVMEKAVLGLINRLQAENKRSAPVVHERWLKRSDNETPMHECSVCGARVVKGLYEYENPNLYCYRCGAKMDLKENGEITFK